MDSIAADDEIAQVELVPFLNCSVTGLVGRT